MNKNSLPIPSNISIGQFHFKELTLDGARSIFGSVADDHCSGIYAYEFTDGTWYVGLAKDVRKRHAQHVEEYRHKQPPLVMRRMLFAEIPHADRTTLEQCETEAIAWFEAQPGISLNNITKTSQPGGLHTIDVSVDGTFGIVVPWERAKRNEDCAEDADLNVYKDESRQQRFERLVASPDSKRLIDIASYYVEQTMPSPRASVGVLWTATAFPAGNAKTALRISCGNLETLVISLDGLRYHGFVNFKMSRKHGARSGKFSKARTLLDHGKFAGLISFPKYRISSGVASISFASLHQLEAILRDPSILDACYQLNAEQMRRGPSMNQASNNGYLCEALLH